MKSASANTSTAAICVLIIVVIGSSYERAGADFVFGPPVNLGPPVNTSGSDGTPCISRDGLSLYFTSNRPGGSGAHDLWTSDRASKEDAWSSPTNLGPRVNSSTLDYFPCIPADGLSLCFYSARSGGRGGGDLWMTTRSNVNSPWNSAVNLGSAINSPREEASPNLSDDGLTLIFSSDRPGGYGDYDLYISTRASIQSPWSIAMNFGPPVNGPHLDVAPSLSSDGLVLFFHSIRPEGRGTYDLYYSRRQSLDAEWSKPVNVGSPINSPFSELGPSLSGDGSCLYWSDHYINPPRPGGLGIDDIWQSSIEPIVDLNSDGIVDAADMCIIVDHWGMYDPLCDIGPMPWGDGIVDTQDLVVLAEHLFEEPGLTAYWKLDEMEGDVAYDSAGIHDGFLSGIPTWQPFDGRIDGALEFDGVDDFVIADFLLDPRDNVFSVFAWIRGGAPGQVIVSQTKGGANWLCADSSGGDLMTEVKGPGRSGHALSSQMVITDGNWHRVGLVWDGAERALYANGIEVARDRQDSLESSSGGIYIGAGKNIESGSLWSGIIDDVRVYDVALTTQEIEALE